LTGANAHQRLVITPGTEANLLAYLLRELAESGRYGNRLPAEFLATVPVFSPEEVSRSTGIEAARLADLLAGFEKAKRPLLIAGGPGTAHADGFITAVLAGLIQWLTGMTEEPVDFARAENYRSVGSPGDAQGLAERLENGEVGVLFIARANPLYHLPAFSADTLGKARLRIGLYDVPDETAAHLDLLLPLSHPLETWGDVQPRAGVRSILRPVVVPLGDSRSEGDILLGILRLGQEIGAADFREFLFAQWRRELDDKSQQDFSRQGYLAAPVQPSRLSLNAAEAAAVFGNWQPGAGVTGPVLVVSPSIRAFDGRSRPLHLLSEIPDPLTTVSYGRWVAVSPSTAERGGMKDGDGLKLIANGWETVLAVKIQPGLTDEIFMIKWESLEQSPQTVDRSSGELNPYIGGLRWERTRRADPIAILAGSTSQHGRGIIPDPVHREEKHHEQYTLYPAHDHPDYLWGMAIDLQLCIGCGACAAACYVENNVPVTGIRDHLRGRELSWLRIEPFYDETGRVGFIPMLCQHCEFAPCEPVCPVYAAYHNPEGLNIQVYARCVGTRYCSHNCPYKVRRFNWWDYHREPPLDRMLNPDLTVRKRGTMEKCTFCIQRIRTARDRAKDEGRKIRDGEVTTACAQSCPTGAIVFGNFLDEDSRVYQLAHSERAYRVFEDLGTESSIYYLKKDSGIRSQASGQAKGKRIKDKG
jgi:Fe-S-cluster-containing dehydrogenase component